MVWMKLTIVRHGQTIENASGIVMGHHHGTLSEKGVEQARTVAKTLKDDKFDQAWASDLKRCVDTATYILEYHPGLELQITEALREVNYGTFQGKPNAQIRKYFDQGGGYSLESKAPEGESHIEMANRVLKFINILYKNSPDERILVVSHNGPIESIRAAVQQTPFAGDAKNAGVLRCVVEEALKPYFED